MSFLIASDTDNSGFWLINSALSFPIGIIFSMYKYKMVEFIKKRYKTKLIISAAVFAASFAGELIISDTLSPFLLICEFMASVSLCALIAVFSVRFKLNSPVLDWFGGISLELYLVFAAFVYFIGNSCKNFGEAAAQVSIILGCTVISAWLVHLAQNIIMRAVKKIFKIKKHSGMIGA